MSENLFLALVARDQCCRWPGCTIRATWCDAHHIIEWTEDGHTSEANCALLCHHHHQLSHQPGWKITGDGNELQIQCPDGAVEVSRPPGATTTTPDPATADRPPGASTPRVDSIGRGPMPSNAPPVAGPSNSFTVETELAKQLDFAGTRA